MPAIYTPITLSDLTVATVDGGGVFDVLMRANKAHLEQEFLQGRIKGTDYSSVYLSSLQAVMQTALQFTLQREQQNIDFQLKSKELDLTEQKIALALAEVSIAEAKLVNIPKEGALIEAQTSKVIKDVSLADQEILVKQQQVLISVAEVGIAQAKLTNIPKEGLLIEAQTSKTLKDVSLMDQEILVKQQQVLISAAEVSIAQAKLVNIPKEGAMLDAQAAVQVQQANNLASEKLRILAQTDNIEAELLNIPKQGLLIDANTCKLQGEFDKTVAETGMIADLRLKTAAETQLLDQKRVTETLQQTVTTNQAALLAAQAGAFDKDYQVKMQDLRVKAWSVARTTDEMTPINSISTMF